MSTLIDDGISQSFELFDRLQSELRAFVPRVHRRLFFKLVALVLVPLIGLIGGCTAVFIWQRGRWDEQRWLVDNAPIVLDVLDFNTAVQRERLLVSGNATAREIENQHINVVQAMNMVTAQLSSGDRKILVHPFAALALYKYDVYRRGPVISTKGVIVDSAAVISYLTAAHEMNYRMLDMPMVFPHVYDLQSPIPEIDALLMFSRMKEALSAAVSAWRAAQTFAKEGVDTTGSVALAMDSVIFASGQVRAISPEPIYEVYTNIVGRSAEWQRIYDTWSNDRNVTFTENSTTLISLMQLCEEQMYMKALSTVSVDDDSYRSALAMLILSCVLVVVIVWLISRILRKELNSSSHKKSAVVPMPHNPISPPPPRPDGGEIGGGNKNKQQQEKTTCSGSCQPPKLPPLPPLDDSAAGYTIPNETPAVTPRPAYKVMMCINLSGLSINDVTPSLRAGNGVAVSVVHSTLTVLFDKTNDALLCAVRLAATFGHDNEYFCVSVHETDMTVFCDREVLFLQGVEHDFAEGMLRLCLAQGCKILISKRVADTQTEVCKCQTRPIGVLSTFSAVATIEVIEVFAADDEEVRRLKEDNRDLYRRCLDSSGDDVAKVASFLSEYSALKDNPSVTDTPLARKLTLLNSTHDVRSISAFAIVLISGEGVLPRGPRDVLPPSRMETSHTSIVFQDDDNDTNNINNIPQAKKNLTYDSGYVATTEDVTQNDHNGVPESQTTPHRHAQSTPRHPTVSSQYKSPTKRTSENLAQRNSDPHGLVVAPPPTAPVAADARDGIDEHGIAVVLE